MEQSKRHTPVCLPVQVSPPPPRGMKHSKRNIRDITSTLWNTIECCRGIEDVKGETSSSLEASDIFWANFLLNVLLSG